VTVEAVVRGRVTLVDVHIGHRLLQVGDMYLLARVEVVLRPLVDLGWVLLSHELLKILVMREVAIVADLVDIRMHPRKRGLA
jgi:hypothetical protein